MRNTIAHKENKQSDKERPPHTDNNKTTKATKHTRTQRFMLVHKRSGALIQKRINRLSRRPHIKRVIAVKIFADFTGFDEIPRKKLPQELQGGVLGGQIEQFAHSTHLIYTNRLANGVLHR